MLKALIVALALAASGDLIYEVAEIAEVTGPQAATLAQAFKTAGAWSGTQANMIRCTVERHAASTTGFRAFCVGQKTAAPGSVPFPVTVTGVVP